MQLFPVMLAVLLFLAPVASRAAGPTLASPILFVTQVHMPNEFNDDTVSNVVVSVVSALGSQLADTAHAGRGGDLWLRYPGGTLTNLTRGAGFGVSGAQDGVGIAVRDPHVHWSGTKAIFSMVVGAPTGPGDTNQFYWQLYEITNLAAVAANTGIAPVIVHVPNQPGNYNNVMPCYGTDGRIIFACDRPRDGAAHLYPQLDEYNDIPTVTGLWSLNPATGELYQLDHSPSGSFHPFVDSFGRLIFTRWDHLVQDRNATDDRLGRATNGTFDFFTESGTNYNLANRPIETFPEPRTFDSNVLAQIGVQGNAFNSFFPWMMNEDGTAQEVLNHVGRHELLSTFRGSSFTNDPNLVQQFNLTPGLRFNTNYLNNFLQFREDPTNPGSYFGIDAPDFGTHASGQILTLYGPSGANADRMIITYITPKSTAAPNALGVYRNALPMSDGTLVASFTPATSADSNIGSAAAPRSRYAYRLITLAKSTSTYTNAQFLTPGLTNAVTYWSGSTLVTQTNALWELQPVEVIARPIPARGYATVADVEAQVFAEEGVELSVMEEWLRTNNLALVISRNVTTRDHADREQPFNLRIVGSNVTTQTLGTNTGKIYDLRHIQFYQADQLRGLTLGTGTTPIPGRRVLAKPLHDPTALAFNVPNPSGPAGSMRLGDDGSQATFVPARRAMSHQLTDAGGTNIVRERYWLTYQPGEIRTCTSCHGINTTDQAGNPRPTNKPQALRDLLRYWKDQTGYVQVRSLAQTNNALRVNLSAPPTRTNFLEATTDFLMWTPISTNIGSSNGLYQIDDPMAPLFPYRFYRGHVP